MAEDNAPLSASETLSPLAKRIRASIAQAVRGNGISPKDIKIIGEESGVFTLHGVLTLALEARREQRQASGRPKGVHIFESKRDMDEEITRACNELRHAPQAQQTLEKGVFQGTTKGFGLQDKIIPIPKLNYDFGVVTVCPSCKGKGKGGCPVCHGSGQVTCPQCVGKREEWCGHCKGTGHQDGDMAKGRCTWCDGIGRTRCLRCDGRGLMNCQPCTGTGHTYCRQCQGHGELLEITHLTFVWHAAFQQISHSPPRAVNHLLAKASLDKLAELGHVAPSRQAGPLEQPPVIGDSDAPSATVKPASLYYHLTAKIPWCETVIKAGTLPAFQASAAGLKGRINNCPNFLDKLQGKTARLQQEAMSHLLRLGLKNADKSLAKLYPIGLSDRYRRDVLKEARTSINTKTRNIQIAAWSIGILSSLGISYVMNSYIGIGVSTALGLALFHAMAIYGKMQFAKENGLKYNPRPKFGWEIAAVAAAAIGAYALNLFMIPTS